MPIKCHVIKCDKPSVAKGLCETHYAQVKRHGKLGSNRPADWGGREKHPAYKAWRGLLRYYRLDMCPTWVENFWSFAKDVGEKPESSQAHRADKEKPWSKENFYWKEKRSSSENRKEYMRDWQRKSRLANGDYYLNSDLKKNYGVTLDWYRETLAAQNGVCAICKQPETTKIRGNTIAMPVDHCHTTGRVRGLLCTQCNRALGLFKDSTEVLQAAISYLQN